MNEGRVCCQTVLFDSNYLLFAASLPAASSASSRKAARRRVVATQLDRGLPSDPRWALCNWPLWRIFAGRH